MVLKGTKFQLKVWKYFKTIPKGRVKTYKQVAISIKTTAAKVATLALKTYTKLKILLHRVIRRFIFGGHSEGGIKKSLNYLDLKSTI